MLSEPSTDSKSIGQQKKKCRYIAPLSPTCNNDIFQSRNTRRTSLAVVLQAKKVYSQTSSLLEYQVNQGHGTRMQAVTFEFFLTTAILPRIQMGKQGSTKIARYAYMLPHHFTLPIRHRWITSYIYRKKGPMLAIVQHNITLCHHIESAHMVCCQYL